MTRLTDKELDRLAARLWKRMEPLARAELERLFTNYMSTRTLLEPELVKKLFEAMEKDLHKFLQEHFDKIRVKELRRRHPNPRRNV